MYWIGGRERLGERQDCSCGENVFYSSSSDLHQYVAMITIFSTAVTMSSRNIPMAPVIHWTLHIRLTLFFSLLILLLNCSASRFLFGYPHYAIRAWPTAYSWSCSTDMSLLLSRFIWKSPLCWGSGIAVICIKQRVLSRMQLMSETLGITRGI